jgi:hypothetical protein
MKCRNSLSGLKDGLGQLIAGIAYEINTFGTIKASVSDINNNRKMLKQLRPDQETCDDQFSLFRTVNRSTQTVIPTIRGRRNFKKILQKQLEEKISLMRFSS